MRQCVYCNSTLQDARSMEICDICGEKVWGKKMFDTIKKNTNEARDKGDLDLMRPDLLDEHGKGFPG